MPLPNSITLDRNPQQTIKTPRLTLRGFKHDLRHNDRINEIFDAYRIKLTGSLECRNENRIYDFIYKGRPGFVSEILIIMYQMGYEDRAREEMQ